MYSIRCTYNICYALLVCLLYAQTVTHGKAPQVLLYRFTVQCCTTHIFFHLISIGIISLSLPSSLPLAHCLFSSSFAHSIYLALLNASRNKQIQIYMKCDADTYYWPTNTLTLIHTYAYAYRRPLIHSFNKRAAEKIMTMNLRA